MKKYFEFVLYEKWSHSYRALWYSRSIKQKDQTKQKLNYLSTKERVGRCEK